MKLEDYLQDCLRDAEFRKYWTFDNPGLKLNSEVVDESVPRLSIAAALRLLNEGDLEDVIKNKGIRRETKTEPKTEILFFEVDNSCPVKDFLESISNRQLKSKTLSNIVRLSLEGSNARPPLSKYVDDGIFELRSRQKSDIDRIFHFFVLGNRLIMTNGHIKKSQKLDKQEFEKAKKYRDMYMRRVK